MQKKYKIIFLISIAIISIGLKLYLVDFSTFPSEDAIGHVQIAITHTNDNFAPLKAKTLGWSLSLFPFFELSQSEKFLDYTNLARIISMSLSTVTIFVMYSVARKFFSEKISIIAAGLFAFEPHLIYNSIDALTEPLYILVSLVAFRFILTQNIKIICFAFIFAGFAWIARWPGLIIFFVISIIYFVNFKKNKKNILTYFLFVSIFFLVVSPFLINRDMTYGDPLYFDLDNNFFTGNFSALQSHNLLDSHYTASDFIEEYGIIKFLDRFIVTGITNLLEQLLRIFFPYLIFLIPFGIILSFRTFNQKFEFIKANWLMILITIAPLVIIFSVIPERRFLYYLFPFLIIFATIPIQRIVEYGVNAFSFSEKQKNILLLIIMILIIITSGLFITRYDINSEEQKEKILLGKFIMNNLDGKILDAGETLQGLYLHKLSTYENINQISSTINPWNFKNLEKNTEINVISLSANSMKEFIEIADKNNLKYISIKQEFVTDIWYPYFSDVYDNEEKYPFLETIVDYEELGFNNLKIKILEINYEKFNKLNGGN